MEQAAKKRRVGDAVLAALDEARLELDARERMLEQREEALRKAVEGVAKETQLMAGRQPGDVLSLNLGGTTIQVLRKTLTQDGKSMLAARFSGRWDDSTEKDVAGSFFIDQPPGVMLPLINFLRAKAIEMPDSIVKVPDLPQPTKADFQRVVEFYGMTPFVYQQKFEVYRGKREMVSLVGGPEPSVDCRAFSTLVLKASGSHQRRLTKFIVVLGDAIERPQIGWANPAGFGSSTKAEQSGPGEDGASVALDSFRGCVMCKGAKMVEVPEVSILAGSVVQCEKTPTHFRWLVDGTQVAEVAFISLPCDLLSHEVYHDALLPTVAGKGQWHVSQFEYEW